MAMQGSDQGAATDSSSSWAVAPAVAALSASAPSMSLNGVLTMAGIFLVFAMFALALVFLQYRFNNGFPTAPGWPPRIGGGVAAGRNDKGVDPELLRSLPVTVYRAASAQAKGSADAEECAVCLAGLEDGEEARFLPRCGHGFHAACVDTWLASRSTCPLCRATVAAKAAEPDAPLTSPRPRLPPVPPEPANYRASALLGAYGQATRAALPSAPAAAALVIDVPEACVLPRDAAARSPGLGRLRSLKRLWSFGRTAGASLPSCSCGSGEGTADVERSVSISTVGARTTEMPPEAATPRPAV